MRLNYQSFMVFAIAGLLLVCTQCSSPQSVSAPGNKETDLTDTAWWFIGSWQNSDGKGITYEQWQRTNDSVLSGNGGYIIGTDTVFSEKLELKRNGNDLYYIPTIAQQNNGQPVYFKLTQATAQMLVFEEPMHDWPQKITYTRVNNDSIFAEVSGTDSGKERREQFPLKRVKP